MTTKYSYYDFSPLSAKKGLNVSATYMNYKTEGRRVLIGHSPNLAHIIHDVILPNGIAAKFVYTGAEHNPRLRRYFTLDELKQKIYKKKYDLNTLLLTSLQDRTVEVVRPTLLSNCGTPISQYRYEEFNRLVRLFYIQDKYANEVKQLEHWILTRSPNTPPKVSEEARTVYEKLYNSHIYFKKTGIEIHYTRRSLYSPHYDTEKVETHSLPCVKGYIKETYVMWGNHILIKTKEEEFVRQEHLKEKKGGVWDTFKETRDNLKREIVEAVFHPDRVERMMEKYGEDYLETIDPE